MVCCSLAKDEWPFLCSRIEFLLSGQKELVPQPVPAAIESLAQRYAARLVSVAKTDADKPAETSVESADINDFQEIDVNSLERVGQRLWGHL
ncbi:MAG: hypothetical protein WC156_12755 [Pedobacter sp.]